MFKVKIKNSLLYLIVFILVMNMSGANILGSRYIPFFVGILLFLITFVKKQLKFDKKIIILIFIWLVINISSMIINAVSFNFFRIIIITVNIIVLPYLLLKEYRESVWVVLEDIVYRLTLISLLIYFSNVVFPVFFNSLTSFFIPITTKSLTVNPRYWSAFIYVHAFADNGYGLLRSNGFMWEPGAMAMMIIWSIIYNWLKDGFKYSKRFFVYTIALLFTFSTAGYISFSIILLAKYIKNLSFINILLIFLFGMAFNYAYNNLSFISGKLDEYSEQYEEDKYGEKGNINTKVNRFQGGVTSIIRTLNQPFGKGLVSADDLNDINYSYGVNGLGSLLEMWGFLVFIFLIIQIYNFLESINLSNSPKLSKGFLFIALMIPFFSNPIARFLLVYLIILSPMILDNNKLKIIHEK